MPSLRKRKTSGQAAAGNAVIAAATLVSRAQVTAALGATRISAGASSWQETAWAHYDRIGELRFGCTWLGNALSRARLYAAIKAEAEDEPQPLPETDAAAVALAALCGGQTGQSEMLKRLGYHLTVPGESFLVGFDNAETGEQEWHTLCADEIREDVSRKVIIQRLGTDFELPEAALIVRIWRPHPRKHWEADSPARGLEVVLTELDKLTRRIGAEADSRLAGAGILFVPSEIEFPRAVPGSAAVGPAGTPDPAHAAILDASGLIHSRSDAEDFAELLTQVMMVAVSNHDDASALVPLIVKVPAEQLEHIKHVTFATPLSAEAEGLRQEAIRRLALGLDMPPEVLTGLGDANHWSGWQIEESAVKGTVEPMLELICHALSVGYLRPVLGLPGDSEVLIWYDTAELVQRPDRSGTAGELYDRGELSGDALRRESGFGEEDAPNDVERRRRMLENLTAADPSLTAALLELLGYVQPGDLPDAPATGEQLPPADDAEPEPVEGTPEQRALPARPSQDAPAGEDTTTTPPAGAPSATASAAVIMARHAMDYAGKRLLGGPGSRARRGQTGDVASWELHTVIDVRTRPGGVEHTLDGALRPFAGTPEHDTCGPLILRHVRSALLSGQPLDDAALYRDALTLAGPRDG